MRKALDNVTMPLTPLSAKKLFSREDIGGQSLLNPQDAEEDDEMSPAKGADPSRLGLPPTPGTAGDEIRPRREVEEILWLKRCESYNYDEIYDQVLPCLFPQGPPKSKNSVFLFPRDSAAW